MPNWVYNSVKTTDKKETLKLLHEESEKLEGGIAMLLIPRPADASIVTGKQNYKPSLA